MNAMVHLAIFHSGITFTAVGILDGSDLGLLYTMFAFIRVFLYHLTPTMLSTGDLLCEYDERISYHSDRNERR